MRPARGRWLTLGMLKKHGACPEGTRAFLMTFGERVFVTERLARMLPADSGLSFAYLMRFVPPRAGESMMRRYRSINRVPVNDTPDGPFTRIRQGNAAFAAAFIRWDGYGE